MLDRADVGNIPAGAEVWEKVAVKLRAGMMPPPGRPRPAKAHTEATVSWLETTIDRAAASAPHPGQPLVHRLNRAEYANAIRDLLALDVDSTTLLPADDASYGFDNIADVLGVSPALMERYLSAAGKISAMAIGDPAISPVDATYRPAPDLTQSQHLDGLPIGTRGGLRIHHIFPLDGEYIIKPRLWRTSLGEHVRGLQYPHDVEISVDGDRVHLATIGGPADFKAHINSAQGKTAEVDERLQIRLAVKAGPHDVAISFLEKTGALPQTLLQPFPRMVDDPIDASGVPTISTVTISGPFKVTGAGDTPSRRRILVCRPANPGEEEPCARRILGMLARRAYRRPTTDADLRILLDFYQSGRQQGGFESGIELALRRVLVDSEFVFRAERAPANAAAGTVHRITDLELASRLSFFLWSSIPDDELLDAASRGTLRHRTVLEGQVRRMLADTRSAALVKNFAGQWLHLRNLDAVAPDRIVFPSFDDNLRQAFRRETELLFESVMREDRSVTQLLSADYTFVNERLAQHYGIPNIYGSQFRRVTVTDENRKGLLGHGSILAVTSLANRTAPTLRGKWILDNLLGTPPPPPPPAVPPLKETGDGGQPATMRAQMEAHRANPTCASCHRMMDPLGFALENFDGVGAWRTRDAGVPIDATGELVSGAPVDGPATLRQALLSDPTIFVGTLTEKLLTYALGRGLVYYDQPAVRAVVREAERQDYRFSSVVMGIVASVPFQMRMKAEEP